MIISYAAEYADLTEYILSEPLVNDVVLRSYDGGLVIAIITAPVFFKSEGDNLVTRIELYAKAAYPNLDVTVTRSAAEFYKIKHLNETGY